MPLSNARHGAHDLPDLLLGQDVDNGRLKLVEVLGSGAYGIVYKALAGDTTSPNAYAVKCLKKYPIGTREAVFQARELKLHSMVSSHHNVVTFHKHFVDAGCVLVVLDYCEGGDLFHVITDLRLFYRNDNMVKEAYVQMLDAVQYCHAHNVYHRDLKPENFLCDSKAKHIRLADFGLSTSSGLTNDYGLGSPYYMSPEALDIVPHSSFSCRHSDIWALGVILTNMISGRNPWRTAQPTDDCFAAYLEDRDFLFKSLPISRQANALLKLVFNQEPLSRPSIANIRSAVVAMKTFFMTDEELVSASPGQRAIAEYYSSHSPVDAEPEEELVYPCDNIRMSGSTIPDDVYLYENHPFDSPKLLAPPSHQVQGDAASLSSSDASSSGGPVTPSTLAVDPKVDVQIPDFPEGQGIGASYFGPKETLAGNQKTRSTFKKALRRISKVIG
ncbi:serine/threonine protein kinase, negative regulator of sexual conjugation and meiosis [Mycena amicta]|nr:serine/threonine protein kinase, negative regulator of sexual conjugation and meiosis [Mycena amicta]